MLFITPVYYLTYQMEHCSIYPLSYIMALLDALFWAAYCTLTARTKAQGNAVGFFFLLVSCILWAKYFAGGYGSLHFDTDSILYAVSAAACMGLGYAVWNIGISCGNMTVLASVDRKSVV